MSDNFNQLNKRYEQNIEDLKDQQDEADWLKELDLMGLLPVDLEKETIGILRQRHHK